MPIYEDNYRLMLRWMPGLHAIRVPVSLLVDEAAMIRLTILERSRYTTCGVVHQGYGRHAQGNRFLRDLMLRFRIYLDARLLEVTAYQGRFRFAPVYPYPNREMMSRFEKRQVNLFIGEWLRARLRLGQCFDEAFDTPHMVDLKVEN